ncbi:hypothetical protein L798_07798 [Zootermopsis nevadensis]|uniref:Uncharacterized protein n=1 Tax=Zootermopsis nevadensis TaxID=136037 RepID=A0A067R4W7_ZOONE|nr:hypothetical protein L798_07798 [Zootermopsis nevadensis]
MFLYYGYFRKSAVERILQRRLQNNLDEQDLATGPYYHTCVWKRKQESEALLKVQAVSHRHHHSTGPLRCFRQPRAGQRRQRRLAFSI